MTRYPRRRFTRTATTLLTLGTLVAGMQAVPLRIAAAELPYRVEPAMTSAYGTMPQHLESDNALIVWQDARSGTPDIYGYDLDDQREFRVARSAGYRTQPAIDGSRVIWVAGADPGSRTIEGIDLSQGSPITVLSDPSTVSDPAISGDTVVWRQQIDGRWEIRAQNIRTGERWTLSADGDNQAYPAISGATVVWQAYRNGGWRIMRYDLPSRTLTQITQHPDDETRPAIDGDWLVFCRQPQSGGPPKLILYSLTTAVEKTLTDDHLVAAPAIHGGIVAWEDWRSGLPDVYAYDTAGDTTFAVARSQQAYNPAVSARGISWISRSDLQRGRVQAVSFIQRLPSDPVDPPAVPSPEHQYFPETHHFLSSGFKAFWQANGGIQIFGLPLTEEYREKDPQTGEEIIVQYFERAKMEYHLSAPEGQRVTLARLGSDLNAGRNFPRSEPFANNADHVYFPETGHSLSMGFKQFWESHGGVAIFGMPISEEMQEGGKRVQYFERARFEYNPDAPDPQDQVTLSLLGQETLRRKGWMPRPPIDTTLIVP